MRGRGRQKRSPNSGGLDKQSARKKERKKGAVKPTKTAEEAPAARSRGRSQRGGKQGRRRQIDTDSLSIET